ncbi:hypothetical protein LRS11_14855 [Pseudomonas sp. J452]|uniref:hypothetical protein n=1 Tax=Pseudomonas sp. J452 TaxID=2898441 RepID=UPI0021ADEE1D|nr:hypothetical protein [Pseudomonas sp. J452]UUY07104.1 hypothetical protein LRS11_14855 [Pseudomonas sp. J452]
MYRMIPLILRISAALLLLGLILWAGSSHSHTPYGVLQVFALSLFFSLGFLLFGGQRFTEVRQERRQRVRHSA